MASNRILGLRETMLGQLRELASFPSASVLRERIEALPPKFAANRFQSHQQYMKNKQKHDDYEQMLSEVSRREPLYAQVSRSLLAQVRRIGPSEWHEAIAHSRHEGSYTVTLLARRGSQHAPVGREERLRDMLVLHCGMTPEVAEETLKRVIHVGPEPVVVGVSLDDAILVKTDIELCGAAAKVKEGVIPKPGKREPIPENVRREVWRRDSGRCVDCGSRERLEFDHIVPVSKGGSNTARNIELRCESCNRRKAASI